jgi:hypothetical protein
MVREGFRGERYGRPEACIDEMIAESIAQSLECRLAGAVCRGQPAHLPFVPECKGNALNLDRRSRDQMHPANHEVDWFGDGVLGRRHDAFYRRMAAASYHDDTVGCFDQQR